MKRMLLAGLLVMLLPVAPVVAAEQTSQDEQQQEPQRAMPHPPQSPLRFMLVKGNDRQWLEVSYVDPKTMAFMIVKSGTCSRHEQGKAKITNYWWLGAETNENEAGEAFAVQEYIYSKSSKCTISLRIEEENWTQATLHEAADCSPNCHLFAESMHLTEQ